MPELNDKPLPYAWYAAGSIALAVAVLGGFLFSTGYFLSVDWIYADAIEPVEAFNYPNQVPWIVLQWWIGYVLPSFVVQRLVMIAFFLLAFWGSVRLLDRAGVKNPWAIFFAACFFVVNPFTYARFIQGQIYFVLACALLPPLISVLFYEKFRSTWGRYAVAGGIGAISVSLSPHLLFLIGALFTASVAIRWKEFAESAAAAAFGLAIVVTLNAWWIFSVGETTNIDRFSPNDYTAYATKVGPAGNVYAEVLAMRGFWGETEGRFRSADADTWIGYAASALILGTAVAGFLALVRSRDTQAKRVAVGLAIAAVCAYVLALGISADNVFAPITRWLYDRIPYYAGMREPHKWLAVTVTIYALFLGFGLDRIFAFAKESKPLGYILRAAVAATLAAATPMMFFGFMGQLRGVHYPESYARLAALAGPVGTDDCDYRTRGIVERCYDTLVLPWHMVLGFGYSRGPITNPAGLVLPRAAPLVADNIEIGRTYSQSARLASKIMEKYFGPRGVLSDPAKADDAFVLTFAHDLRSMGIVRIVLFGAADWRRYEAFLDAHATKIGLSIIEKNDDWTLYRLE